MRRLVSLGSLVALALAPCGASAAPANTCVFTVSLTSGVDVNNLDMVVDYAPTGGNVEGTPTRPECARALSGQAFASYHDYDDLSQLRASLIRLGYFSAPTALFACRIFYDSLEPIPADFAVVVEHAGRDGEDDNVVPKPSAHVSSVECPGELPDPTTTTTLPSSGGCGVPVSGGSKPTASDALFVLRAAVGGAQCDPCSCDVDGNGSVAAGDALAVLRAAVGGEVALNCPPC